jgi:hypothetical protein
LTILPSRAVPAFERPDQFGDTESVAPDRNEVKDHGVLQRLAGLSGPFEAMDDGRSGGLAYARLAELDWRTAELVCQWSNRFGVGG